MSIIPNQTQSGDTRLADAAEATAHRRADLTQHNGFLNPLPAPPITRHPAWCDRNEGNGCDNYDGSAMHLGSVGHFVAINEHGRASRIVVQLIVMEPAGPDATSPRKAPSPTEIHVCGLGDGVLSTADASSLSQLLHHTVEEALRDRWVNNSGQIIASDGVR